MTKPIIPAAHRWKSNAELIADVAALGYITKDSITLDCTYGKGIFWKKFKPDYLVASDIDPKKSPYGASVSVLDMPWDDGDFDVVVYDGPYKLNGTPDPNVDERYGTAEVTPWQNRMALLLDGMSECARVLDTGGYLLMKVQDQVCSGQVRWQTDRATARGKKLGLKKVDRFDMVGHARVQPMKQKGKKDRVQKHAHGRPSTLLVFRKS